MRKFIVGLLGVGLLAVGTPAGAQVISPQFGTADPLSLISSGAVIPYVGNGAIAPGSMSFLELSSPVGDNSGGNQGGIGGTHMFFFDASCVKGPASVGIPLTTNDFIIQRVDNIDSNAVEGLIAIGGVDDTGFFLQPLESPIHARMLWFDAVTNTVRTLEPIGLQNFEGPTQTWNPLRTGAAFVALPEGAHNGITSNTTIYLVCPTPSVAGFNGVFPNPNSHGPDFPLLVPQPAPTTGIDVRVYGDDERFLRNGTTACSCLTRIPVTAINGAGDIYSSAQFAPFGTLTELESHPTKVTLQQAKCGALCGSGDVDGCQVGATTIDGSGKVTQADLNFCLTGAPPQQLSVFSPSISQTVRPAFTGYRGMIVNGLDVFGRLSNGSAQALEGGSPNGR
jgi:hypothetical protein